MIVVVAVWGALMVVAVTTVMRRARTSAWLASEARRVEEIAAARAKRVTLEGAPGEERWIGSGGKESGDGIELVSRELVLLAPGERIALPLRSQVFLIASNARLDATANVHLPGGTELLLYEPTSADSLVLHGDRFDSHRARLLGGPRILLAEPGVRLFGASPIEHRVSAIYVTLVLAAGLHAATRHTLAWNVIVWVWAVLLALDGLHDWPWTTAILTRPVD